MFCVYRCPNVLKWPDRIVMHNVNVYHIYLISIYLSIYPPIYLSTHLSFYLPTYLSVYLSIYKTHTCIYIYIYMYIHPFSKRLQFVKKWNIYTFCLISHQKYLFLIRKQKVCIYFTYIFKLQHFWKRVFIYIYICIYVCLYFLVF